MALRVGKLLGKTSRIDERSRVSSNSGLGSSLEWKYKSENWSFKKGDVQLNDQSVNKMVNENSRNSGFLAQMASAVQDYRNNSGRDDIQFNGKMQALQEKVGRRLYDIYDEKKNGMRVEYSKEKDMAINGVRLDGFVKLYCLRPTPKARVFLENLREKLNWTINHSTDTTHFDGLRDKAKVWLSRIDEVLQKIPAIKSLPAANDRPA